MNTSRKKFVIEQTQRFCKEIAGKSIDKNSIVIDHYACWDNDIIGRNTISSKTGKIIIYDNYFVKYADDDLIIALIVHECCHFKLKEHRTEKGKKKFQELFNHYYPGSFDVMMRTTFKDFLKKLQNLGVYKDFRWVRSLPEPKDPRVRELLKKEGVELSS